MVSTIQQQVSDTKPTEVMVFGERNSGTNLAHALLKRNIPAFAESPGDRIEKYGFRYGWKHGFPQMLTAPDKVLAIAVFRHPETWVRAMHARPWHVAPELRKLPFETFIRTQWKARVDERNFGVDGKDPRAMQELHWDRHPLTGDRFENILALRNAKTRGFLSLANRFANCVLIRQEDGLKDQKAFVEHISSQYGIEMQKQFQPVKLRRGKSGDGVYAPSNYAELPEQDRRFVWSELDREQETMLGYSPGMML